VSLNRFSLSFAVASTMLACHRAPVIVEGCATPLPARGDRIRIAHRRFPSPDRGRAVFVVHLESSYPSMEQLADAYISLKTTAQPEAAAILAPDGLYPGMYTHRTAVPGLYTVFARRIGFHAVVDTVRLDAGWIDSATYHTVADVVCLSSVEPTARISTMLPNER
jgi:hypothetical protein